MLRWGNRRQLAALEKIGHRFCWFGDRYFKAAPFLLVHLDHNPLSYLLFSIQTKIRSNFFSQETYISGTEISGTELKAAVARIPPHLRFDFVQLNYITSCIEGTNEGGIEWVRLLLHPFKQALTGSKFKFIGAINADVNNPYGDDFKNHTALLDHINNLLQMFDPYRTYKFRIQFNTDERFADTVIAAILRFNAIIRCSNVYILLDFCWPASNIAEPTDFSIKAIDDWLNHSNLDTNSNQTQKDRFLQIKLYDEITNIKEIFEHLKKVC